MRALLAALLLLLPGLAPAHMPNLSVAHLKVGDATATAEVTVNLRDLEAALGPGADDDSWRAYVAAHVTVGPLCTGTVGPPQTVADHVTFRLDWSCRAVPRAYRATLFHREDPATRHIVVVRDAAGERQAMLDAARPTVPLGSAPSWSEVALQYLALGVEHIVTGYDHLAFVLAVVLWSRRFAPVVKIVTAFTLAHSLTLAAAALGLVVLPGGIVELAIAASIVYVAAENFASREVDRRWRVAFLLGLVHGFGFAGVLEEIGLPEGAAATSLAAFNIGVELGQVAVVAAVVPLLLLIDRRFTGSERSRALVYPASAAILALGLWLFLDRLALA